MAIYSKYTKAYKVTELPSTNIDREALYIVGDGKSETFIIAVRDKDNNQWHILERLELGTTADTAAAGNHTHQLTEISGLVDALESKEDVSNKKTDIEDNKDSNTFYAPIKSIYDWAVGKFLDLRLSNLASDLDETEKDEIKGKLDITETDLSNYYDQQEVDDLLDDKVSLTGDETISGKKTFGSVPESAQDATAENDLIRKSQWDAYNASATSMITSGLNAKEDRSNKKTAIETNKSSNTFYPSIRAVYDWAVAKFLGLRLENLASDLNETEQDVIKTKLDIREYDDSGILSQLEDKVDKEAGMGLSSNDFTTAEKQKLAGLEEPNYRGTFSTETAIQAISSPKSGNYALLDLGVGEDVVPYFYDITDEAWVVGGGSTELTPAQLKSLYESNPDTNAFTDLEKSKLAGIATEATKNQTDTYLRNRANHTGSQAMSTITGLSGALDSKEPKFTKNSAFNKDFGTNPGTVAEGDHTHEELHKHDNIVVLDGITPTKVGAWNDVADFFLAGKLMYSGFDNAEYASTASPDALILVRNPDKTVGLIPLNDITTDTSELLNRDFTNPEYAIYDDPADHPYFLMGGDGKGVAVVSPEQAKEQLNISLQHLIDDSIADHSDGYLALDFTGTGYAYLLFPSGALIEDDGSSFAIMADNTYLVGSQGALALGPLGNFFSDKDPSPKGIQYENDYSATYTNRSLVDKGYVDKAISDIPNTNNNNKWFIGSNANPLDTPTIDIDTQGLMQGHEIVITYERTGQVELPLIVSSRPDVKIYLQSINNSVNFEGNGALNRIYLHLMEVVGGDTYYFDITAGKIDTYTNV